MDVRCLTEFFPHNSVNRIYLVKQWELLKTFAGLFSTSANEVLLKLWEFSCIIWKSLILTWYSGRTSSPPIVLTTRRTDVLYFCCRTLGFGDWCEIRPSCAVCGLDGHGPPPQVLLSLKSPMLRNYPRATYRLLPFLSKQTLSSTCKHLFGLESCTLLP